MTKLGKLIARRVDAIEHDVNKIRAQMGLDRFCKAGRHKECMSPTCGCACHTKEKITPLRDLLNQDLFK